jgi:hypothetical protein
MLSLIAEDSEKAFDGLDFAIENGGSSGHA